jgi:hypothetical protein
MKTGKKKSSKRKNENALMSQNIRRANEGWHTFCYTGRYHDYFLKKIIRTAKR